MKSIVIYFSVTGNTEKVARSFQKAAAGCESRQGHTADHGRQQVPNEVERQRLV